jgi:hypothetical protein
MLRNKSSYVSYAELSWAKPDFDWEPGDVAGNRIILVELESICT